MKMTCDVLILCEMSIFNCIPEIVTPVCTSCAVVLSAIVDFDLCKFAHILNELSADGSKTKTTV